MSSIEIAELIGREHKSVMRSIRNMEAAWEKVCGCKFALTSRQVQMPNGGFKNEDCYELTKKECLYISTKFNDEARAILVNRWEALETGQATPMCNQPQLPTDYLSALKALVASEEEKQSLLLTNKQQKETIEKLEEMTAYTRLVLKSSSTILVTQIAQDYGMSAVKFNATLRDMNIQRKVGGQWILRSKFLDKGYVQSETKDITHKDGTPDVVLTTKWTQKGRLFLYRELKKTGILPVIEQNILFQEGGRYEN